MLMPSRFGRRRVRIPIEEAGVGEHLALLQDRDDLLVAVLVRLIRFDQTVLDEEERFLLASFGEDDHSPREEPGDGDLLEPLQLRLVQALEFPRSQPIRIAWF